MKVLVVATNRCRDPEPVLPAGACLVAEAAERAGHEVRLIDLMFAAFPALAVRRAVTRSRPDVVVLSVRNLDNSDPARTRSYLPGVRALVAAARAGRRPVAVGGSAVSVDPVGVGRMVGADWVLTGDGERVLPGFLAALDAREDPATVPGVGRVGGAPPRHPHPHRDPPPPTPDYRRWVRWRAYRRRLASAPVQTKRGCPFRCAYCTYPSVEGRSERLRDPEAVAADLERLGSGGVRHAEIVDSVFNSPASHALEVCRAAARVRHGVALTTHDLSPVGLDADLADALVAAGFTAAGVSIESASDPTLEGLGKPFDAARVRQVAQLLRPSPLALLWVALLGGPGETEATARETLDFLGGVLRPGDAAWVGVGIRIYPGTPLAERARAEGLIDADTDLVEPTFYRPERVTLETLGNLVAEAAGREPRILWGGAPGWWMLPVLRRTAGALGWEPPLWRHAPGTRRWLQRMGLA